MVTRTGGLQTIEGVVTSFRTTSFQNSLRGQEVFFGKGQCATCHLPPYYTDNSMHNLHTEGFFKQELVNGMVMAGDGPIKTFPLRGIKDSPPYLHDGRLVTLVHL